MNEILAHPVQSGKSVLTNKGCDIVFDHVGFAYIGEENVLRDVSFTAGQGKVTALIRPSGGECQRISIARAFLKNAPIILPDEATASLDVENETLIQSAISQLIRDKTVLIIAHRMRTVADADKIVVLDSGRVAQQGVPKELLKQEGLFKHMVELQNKAAGV